MSIEDDSWDLPQRGKRFVNSFKRRAFLAHIVESALPTHIDPSRWKNDETCQVSGVCFYRPSKRRAADELSSRACISPESEENAPDILIGVGFTRLRFFPREFVYVTKRDSLTALLALSLKGIIKPAMPDKYWFKFRHPLSQLL
ncbi:hypothetical protein TSUD_291820 [Trifolium subterraneum]|uniref:Uncharacterized protein n=1 Tax=Trifolium subterraneum TaxID=3900 RepID=A0A2Z6NYF8_TRISU|nr:hypothetical protein TSUD_291820 [Trifolium subterraneum]